MGPYRRRRTSWTGRRRRGIGSGCRTVHGGAIGPGDNVDLSGGVACHKEPPLTIPSKPNRSETVIGTFRIILILHDGNHSRGAVCCSSWHTVAECEHKKKIPGRVIPIPASLLGADAQQAGQKEQGVPSLPKQWLWFKKQQFLDIGWANRYAIQRTHQN